MGNTIFEWQKDITKLIDNITAPARKIHGNIKVKTQLPDFIKWQQTLLPFSNIPTVEIPGINNKTPLALYYTEMQSIATRILSIQEPFDNIDRICREFEDAKAEAENNYYHRLYVEEKEQEIKAKNKEVNAANARNAELDARVYELETTLRTMYSLNAPVSIPRKKAALSLKPCITPSQIVRLYEATQWLFTSTSDQWRNLFSENIQVFDIPIAVTSKFKSDVRVLFHYLQEKGLIDTLNYPSILEKIGAFSYEGKIITARQLHKPKEYDNYPKIGNYIDIKEIVDSIYNTKSIF